MNYEERLICLLDILAFRAHVEGTVDASGNEVEANVDRLVGALRDIQRLTEPAESGPIHRVEVSQFSDSVVISFPVGATSGVFDALLSILWVQCSLVLRGMLCRGAVTIGKLIHTSELLVGPAMVEAYTLESSTAVYPRVILSEAVIRAGGLAHAPHHNAEMETESILALLEVDTDERYYVDYITCAQNELDDPELDHPLYIARLRNLVADGLRSSEASVIRKHEWLRAKLTPYLRELKRGAAKLENQEVRAAYEAIPDLEEPTRHP